MVDSIINSHCIYTLMVTTTIVSGSMSAYIRALENRKRKAQTLAEQFKTEVLRREEKGDTNVSFFAQNTSFQIGQVHALESVISDLKKLERDNFDLYDY